MAWTTQRSFVSFWQVKTNTVTNETNFLYPLSGSLACAWTAGVAGKLELVAGVTNCGCGSCRPLGLIDKETHSLQVIEGRWEGKVEMWMGLRDELRRKTSNLCHVLCWQDRVAHVPAPMGWCQDGGRKVGEVGLDLGEGSCWHDEALLGLGGVDNPGRRQRLRRHLHGTQMQSEEHFLSVLSELKFKEKTRWLNKNVTCLMLCAETMGTVILTAPALTTIGLASGGEATSDLMYNFYTWHSNDTAEQSPVCMELVLGPLVCPTPLAVVAVTRRT